jgi:hypothetical protein
MMSRLYEVLQQMQQYVAEPVRSRHTNVAWLSRASTPCMPLSEGGWLPGPTDQHKQAPSHSYYGSPLLNPGPKQPAQQSTLNPRTTYPVWVCSQPAVIQMQSRKRCEP